MRFTADVFPTMFRPLPEPSAKHVDLTIEGARVSVAAGTSVAAALMQAGVVPSRTTPVTQSPRAAYCMMGVCFECLVEIDGVPNRQACMIQVAEGMQVRRQHGTRALAWK